MCCAVSLFVTICALSIWSVEAGWATRQQHINVLLGRLHEQNGTQTLSFYYPGVEKLNIFDGNWSRWSNPDIGKQLYKLYKEGLLEKDGIFSEYDDKKSQAALALAVALGKAATYDAFIEMSYWARYNVNPDIFCFSFNMAAILGPYLKENAVPPLYEVKPYYFYNNTVIQSYRSAKDGDLVMATHLKKFRYYTEDIGLNAYYAYTHIMQAEDTFWRYQQLLARYQLELGNFKMNTTEFKPDLIYPDGRVFPNRIGEIEYCEHCRYYFNDTCLPSAYQHIETRLRDPSSYNFIQRMLDKIDLKLEAYTKEKLEFPGVQIDDFNVGNVSTFFEPYITDLSSAITISGSVAVEQRRLNHVPFDFNIVVTSDEEQHAVIRIFMCPNAQSPKRHAYFQLDHFKYHLREGTNKVRRNSEDSEIFSSDLISYHDLIWKRLSGIIVPPINKRYNFPRRLAIPKGSHNGTEYKIYAIVSPLDNEEVVFPFDKPAVDLKVKNACYKTVKVYHLDKPPHSEDDDY